MAYFPYYIEKALETEAKIMGYNFLRFCPPLYFPSSLSGESLELFDVTRKICFKKYAAYKQQKAHFQKKCQKSLLIGAPPPVFPFSPFFYIFEKFSKYIFLEKFLKIFKNGEKDAPFFQKSKKSLKKGLKMEEFTEISKIVKNGEC